MRAWYCNAITSAFAQHKKLDNELLADYMYTQLLAATTYTEADICPVIKYISSNTTASLIKFNETQELLEQRNITHIIEVHRSPVNAEHRPKVRPKALARFGSATTFGRNYSI